MSRRSGPASTFHLQSASLGRRVLASVVDGLIVLLAAGLFGGIFWKVAAVRPPLVQLLGIAARESSACSGRLINIC